MNLQKQILKFVVLFFYLSLLDLNITCQLVDVSNSVFLETDHTGGHLGSGVSFADFNSDDIDDLTFGHHTGQIRFYQGNGIGFDEIILDINNEQGESKMVLWADIDNDGDQDLLITNRNASNKLFVNNGSMQFTDVSETCGISTNAESKSYGASFGDYNNDGFLDLYICNYHTYINSETNELYLNNGNGTFSDVTEYAGVGNDLAQTFQSNFIDIDNDGLLDLHIINDRIQWPNFFFKNNGNGTFTDMAMIWGVNLPIYAMSTSFSDYDRDGDMDLYVTNGTLGNVLLRNDLNLNYSFTDVTNLMGVAVNMISWGAAWLDHDNNTYPDLYVSTGVNVFTQIPEIFEIWGDQPNSFFTNNLTGPFNDISSETPANDQYSFAVATGDYNNDGFPDLISHKIGNNASMLSGVPNENHYIKIRPQGVTVNRDAVGSTVKVFHPGGVEMNMVFCGDKYLAQNSRHLHFGLGSITQLDSVQVSWPGGSEEIFKGLLIDSSVVLIEGTSSDSTSSDDCPEPISYCGDGTVWDDTSETCVYVTLEDVCPTDVNTDGYTNVTDLILLLTQFGTFCTE